LRRLLVERAEAVDDVVDGLVEGPHRDLRGDRGDLDRDVVDIIAGEQAMGLLEVVMGLAVTEHGRAEETDGRPVTGPGHCGRARSRGGAASALPRSWPRAAATMCRASSRRRVPAARPKT